MPFLESLSGNLKPGSSQLFLAAWPRHHYARVFPGEIRKGKQTQGLHCTHPQHSHPDTQTPRLIPLPLHCASEPCRENSMPRAELTVKPLSQHPPRQLPLPEPLPWGGLGLPTEILRGTSERLAGGRGSTPRWFQAAACSQFPPATPTRQK